MSRHHFPCQKCSGPTNHKTGLCSGCREIKCVRCGVKTQPQKKTAACSECARVIGHERKRL